VSKEIEPVIDKMLGWHDEHRACGKSVISRLESVEERIAKTENVLVEHSNVHVELRSEFSKDLQAASKILTDLEVTVDSCAKAESLTAGLKRVDYLEQLLGESVGNHAKHKASMEKRLELIEKQLGDNVKMLAEHADNHSSHKTTVEKQREFFEKLINDNAQNHVSEVEAPRVPNAPLSPLKNVLSGIFAPRSSARGGEISVELATIPSKHVNKSQAQNHSLMHRVADLEHKVQLQVQDQSKLQETLIKALSVKTSITLDALGLGLQKDAVYIQSLENAETCVASKNQVKTHVEAVTELRQSSGSTEASIADAAEIEQ
jgi:uncharacterized coiled-coil protein SlyX